MNPSRAIQDFEVALTRRLSTPIPVKTPAEVGAVWSLAGLEVALAREPIAAHSLRRVWRAREAGRGLPLLLVSPSAEASESVSVFGPRELSEGAPFTVQPEALVEELTRIRNDAPGPASRNIEQALDVLSSAVLPGVVAHGLLTDHFVLHRLPRNPHHQTLDSWAEPARGMTGWRERLEALGYTLSQRQQGYLAAAASRPVILIHVYPSPSEFARMQESGRLPEGALIAACHDEGVSWGILAAADTLRLFQAKVDRGAATDRWLELDPGHLDPEKTYLLGLLAPGSLHGDVLLQSLINESRNFGAELYERLDDQIRKYGLPAIWAGPR